MNRPRVQGGWLEMISLSYFPVVGFLKHLNALRSSAWGPHADAVQSQSPPGCPGAVCK